MLVEMLEPIKTNQGTIAKGQQVNLPEMMVKKLTGKIKLLTGIKKQPVALLPKWQHDLCIAHGMFNNWCGSCPCSLADCLISKIIEAGSDINKLRGLEIGQGITTDMVIKSWLDSGEPAEDLFKKPAWLICISEQIRRSGK